MKPFHPTKILRGAILCSMLALAAMACKALLPSPVPTLPPSPTDIPPLPTAGSSVSSSPPESATPPTLSVMGEDIPIAGANHIEEGATATDWNSDPPTSGQHYPKWAPAGFYDEAIPDGYLVHNMEHGYVIIYYNCEVVAEMDCEAFKIAIEAAMAAAGNDSETNTIKIIAVPRPAMSNPITYASWGHLYKAATFSPDELVLYVLTFRSNPDYAPEWMLP